MMDILVIDDEKLILWGLKRDLERVGYRVWAYQNAEEPLPLIEKHFFHAAIVDVRLPGLSGPEFLEKFKRIYPDTPVIMITAFAEIELAVSLIRKGAFDFIVKPFSLEKIHLSLENALETSRLKKEISSLKVERAQRQRRYNLLGQSRKMKAVLDSVEKIGKIGAAVILIFGETGTGKGLVASELYLLGPRAANPFIEINCSAIPENLFESELFGHERGAYTGANEMKKGLMEMGDGGTLFLDEVGEMPLTIQTKFLKAIEEQNIWRIGGNRPIQIDANIIAATNCDLPQLAREGKFREDLFYRLNVIPIFIPPLRDREGDSLLLANHFLQVYKNKYKRDFSGFSDEARKKILSYNWPGNIRELKNSVERAVILEVSDSITETSLGLGNVQWEHQIPPKTRIEVEPDLPERGMNLVGFLDEIEKKYLEKALHSCKGNQSQAAKLVGMTRDIFRYRLKKYQIPE